MPSLGIRFKTAVTWGMHRPALEQEGTIIVTELLQRLGFRKILGWT